jgi:hypothetical protein
VLLQEETKFLTIPSVPTGSEKILNEVKHLRVLLLSRFIG